MKKSNSFIKLCQKYGIDPDNVPEITSFAKACAALKLSPDNLPKVGNLPARFRKRLIADYKLSVIAEAIRGGKVANYTDLGEPKYHAVFQVKADQKRPSGFGLSYNGYDGWSSDSYVGVRLSFANRDQTIFFGKHFLKEHTDHQLLT